MAIWYCVLNEQVALKDDDPDNPGTQVNKPISANVAFLIDIPAGDNQAGVAWHDSVVDEDADESGVVQSNVPNLQADHLTQWNNLQSGAMRETLKEVVYTSAYLTDAQRDTEINDFGQSLESDMMGKWQLELAWHGRIVTIP